MKDMIFDGDEIECIIANITWNSNEKHLLMIADTGGFRKVMCPMKVGILILTTKGTQKTKFMDMQNSQISQKITKTKSIS